MTLILNDLSVVYDDLQGEPKGVKGKLGFSIWLEECVSYTIELKKDENQNRLVHVFIHELEHYNIIKALLLLSPHIEELKTSFLEYFHSSPSNLQSYIMEKEKECT